MFVASEEDDGWRIGLNVYGEKIGILIFLKHN